MLIITAVMTVFSLVHVFDVLNTVVVGRAVMFYDRGWTSLPPRVCHCLVAALGKAKATGVNPDRKSGVGDPKAVPSVVFNPVLASVLRRH